MSCAMTIHEGSNAAFVVLTGITLIDWQVLIVLMSAIILFEINWHNLSTLTEWEVENFEQRCKKKTNVKINDQGL